MKRTALTLMFALAAGVFSIVATRTTRPRSKALNAT